MNGLIIGASCPNLECSERDVCSDWRDNITKRGKTGNGDQRIYCDKYSGSFIATKGTGSHRKRTSEKERLTTLALVAKGAPLRGRIRRHKKETVQRWINEAHRRGEEVENKLRKNHKLTTDQIKRLWSRVKKS